MHATMLELLLSIGIAGCILNPHPHFLCFANDWAVVSDGAAYVPLASPWLESGHLGLDRIHSDQCEMATPVHVQSQEKSTKH